MLILNSLTAVAILRVVVLYKNRWNTNPTGKLSLQYDIPS